MPAALGIAPPNDDEFLAVEAFRLQPGSPVRLVPAVNALRDDPFEAMLTGEPMEGRALANLVIRIHSGAPIRNASSRVLRSTSGRPVRSSPSRYSRSNTKKTSDAPPVSVAFWMRLNAVRPSGSTLSRNTGS